MDRRCWEDLVLSNPDEVDAGALFDDLDSDDERQQYEAAAGLYWLANTRSERLWLRRDHVVALLGTLPDGGLGDGDGAGTRSWAAQAVGTLADARPALLPAVFDQAANADVRTREDAFLALSCSARRSRWQWSESEPPPIVRAVRDHRETARAGLESDRPVIEAAAWELFATIVPWYDGAACELVTDAVHSLENDDVRWSAGVFLQATALHADAAQDEAVAGLARLLAETDDTDEWQLSHQWDTLIELAGRGCTPPPSVLERAESLSNHESLPVRERAVSVLDATGS